MPQDLCLFKTYSRKLRGQTLHHPQRLRGEHTRSRRERAEQERVARLEQEAAHKLAHLPELTKGAQGAELDRKRSVIEAALARARARRESS